MIRRWLALTYYLYALRLATLSHFILIHYKSSLHFVGRKDGCSKAVGGCAGCF